MRYLDTGAGDSARTLGAWMRDVMTDEVTELRWQTGFFSSDALGFLVPTIRRLRAQQRLIVAVIGANDHETSRRDVEQLAALLGVPSAASHLRVVSFADSYFHPKTYHLRREDGSQAAYVGSANLTRYGVSRHVEAGVALDTMWGNPPEELDAVAAAIDYWLAPGVPGSTGIDGQSSIDQLVASGVLAQHRSARPGVGGGSGWDPRPRRGALLSLPPWSRLGPVEDVPATDELSRLAMEGTFFARTNLQRDNQMQILQSLHDHVPIFQGRPQFEFVQEQDDRRRFRAPRPAGGRNTLKLEMAGDAYRAEGPVFVEIHWNPAGQNWHVASHRAEAPRAAEIRDALAAFTVRGRRAHANLHDPPTLLDWMREPHTVYTRPSDVEGSSQWLFVPDEYGLPR